MTDQSTTSVKVQTKTAASPPILLRVFVRSPGGKPIEKAKVILSETKAEVETNKNGIAVISLREDELDALSERTRDDGIAVRDVSLEASKDHHGPIATGAAVFQNGPAKVKTELSKKTRTYAVGAPDVDQPAGATRRLNIVLVEGGTLGELYDEYTGWVRLRRLSSEQVQRELIWRIAHGEVVLENGHEPTFTHDTTQTSCTAACKITGPNVTTARVLMKSNVVCGVQIRSFLTWDGEHNAWIDSNPMSFNWQPLHQRLIVGLARFCQYAGTSHAVKVMFSQGFKTPGNDAHEDGRAFDLGGVACDVVTEKRHTIRDGVDFLIPSHWGVMHMRVQKLGSAAPEWLGSRKNTVQYNDIDKPNSSADTLLYRLDPVPDPGDRDASARSVSTAHLEKAKEMFLDFYEFFSQEFTHRSEVVGPLVNPPRRLSAAQVAYAEAEDAAAVPAIGSVTGNIFHPDVPKSHPGKSGREAHFNHFHVQIGTIAMGPEVP